MYNTTNKHTGFKTDRIKTLSDSIFAIAMTLLVLDVKDSAGDSDMLSEQLRLLFSKLFPYAVSFLILGIYWTGHHSQFHYIKRTNRIHLWLNVVLLMFVALIPFTASLLSEKKLNQFSVFMYGINITAVLTAFYIQWWYATCRHRLIHAKLDARIVQDVKKRMIIQLIAFAIAMAISYLSPTISILLFLLIQLSYLFVTTQTTTGLPPDIEETVSKEQTENEDR